MQPIHFAGMDSSSWEIGCILPCRTKIFNATVAINYTQKKKKGGNKSDLSMLALLYQLFSQELHGIFFILLE